MEARSLADNMLEHFWDEEHSGFFTTSNDHEQLVQRLKDLDDNATPSGNSVGVEVLLKLWAFTGNERYQQCAARILRKLGPVLEKHPYGFARLLGALDLYLSGPQEIGLRGEPSDPATQAMLRAAFTPFLPNKVIGLTHPGFGNTGHGIAFLNDRPAVNGQPTAYVCQNFACKAPVTTAEALARQLQEI